MGWVPTIRGALSLDLLDSAADILGDVDKYSVRFKRTHGFRCEHYLLASSLLTVNDRKSGQDYARTFRYIFTGSINNEEHIRAFLADKGLEEEEDLKGYIREKGILLGRLTIVTEVSQMLTSREVTFLRDLKELQKDCREYWDDYFVRAVPMDVLQAASERLYTQWSQVNRHIREIENDANQPRPTFCFDVALTRDGILLLTDKTVEANRAYYAAPGTADDYTQNVPIHRLFKVAMNYVKFLFHFNYHHDQEHDTYLPASNLHPVRGEEYLDQVFKHQLDAFLTPIIRLRRKGFADYNGIDANGVMLYAEAFIRVFQDNGLVRQDVALAAGHYLGILKEEVENMTYGRRAKTDKVPGQYRPLAFVTAVFTLVLTLLKITNIFVPLPHLDFSQPGYSYIPLLIYAGVVIGALAVGCLGYVFYRKKQSAKRFKQKRASRSWLMSDSDLDRSAFSKRYQWYICANDIRLAIRKIIKGQVMTIGDIVVTIILLIAVVMAICIL